MTKSITEIVAQKPQIAQFSAAELQACIKGHRLTDALNFLESRGTKSETALFILSQANQECIGCGDRRVMLVEFPEGKEHPHYQAAIRCAYCDTFRGWQLRLAGGVR
jgi:aspartate carbamoyltransferase regulatory subunit